MEQLVTADGERAEILADVAFQAGVGFECSVTVTVGIEDPVATNIVAVGSEYWIDAGGGWTQVGRSEGRFLEETCGVAHPVFANPPAGSLIASGDPVEDTLAGRDALRFELNEDRIGQSLVLGDIRHSLGAQDALGETATLWIVDRSWIGRLEVVVNAAPAGPFGVKPHDHQVVIEFTALDTEVTVAPPPG